MIRYITTYFVRGKVNDCYGARINYALQDPPVAGQSHAFIIGEGPVLTLFHPFTVLGYKIPNTAMEMALAKTVEYDVDKMIDLIQRKIREYKELHMARDFRIAELAIIELKALIDDFEVGSDVSYHSGSLFI